MFRCSTVRFLVVMALSVFLMGSFHCQSLICGESSKGTSSVSQNKNTDSPSPSAAGDTEQTSKKSKPEEKSYDFSIENSSVTTHVASIGGADISYTAEAATYVLKSDDGKAKARIFYTAYTRNDVKELSIRPVTFAFNGGPGSSSVWLHMGAFGPRKVKLDKNGFPLAPPAEIEDNPLSILDVTDLVFIDPVTTGYSRAVDVDKASEFHGVEKDIESVGEFVRLYVTRKGRWLSPKYLSGESYGTLRAAALTGYMSRRFNMAFNGLILVSSILDYQTVSFVDGNDLPYPLFLPTYTATAWHYKKLPASLQKLTLRQVVDKSKAFASDEYTVALFKGNLLTGDERAKIIETLSQFTGLEKAFIDDSNLRVSLHSFIKRILKAENKVVGRMDSRYNGPAVNRVSSWAQYDPSLSYLFGPFASTFNHYVRNELKFESDLPYEVLTGKTRPWNWKPFHNSFVNVLPRLEEAFNQNPYLRIFVANGYFDGATPLMGTEYTFSHMTPLPFTKNVTMKYYEGGHMMYTRHKCLEKLKKDLARWLDSE